MAIARHVRGTATLSNRLGLGDGTTLANALPWTELQKVIAGGTVTYTTGDPVVLSALDPGDEVWIYTGDSYTVGSTPVGITRPGIKIRFYNAYGEDVEPAVITGNRSAALQDANTLTFAPTDGTTTIKLMNTDYAVADGIMLIGSGTNPASENTPLSKFRVNSVSADTIVVKASEGNYDAGTTYAAGVSVLDGGIVYTSIQAGNIGHTPASSPSWWVVSITNWTTVGGQGPNYPSGTAVQFPSVGNLGPTVFHLLADDVEINGKVELRDLDHFIKVTTEINNFRTALLKLEGYNITRVLDTTITSIRGAYNSGNDYLAGQTVLSSGTYYFAIAANGPSFGGAQAVTNASYWTAVPSSTTASMNYFDLGSMHIIGASRGVVRMQYGSHHGFVRRCLADSNGADRNSFFTGYVLVGSGGLTVHDIVFEDCWSHNSFQADAFHKEFTGVDPWAYSGSGGEYVNGDGFTTEEDDYNILFLRCGGSSSHDSIFDLKSGSTKLEDCFASGAKRNYRFHNSDSSDNMDHGFVMVNCVSEDPNKRGGTGNQSHIALDDCAAVAINCDFRDTSPSTILFEADGGVLQVVNSSILRHTNATLSSGGGYVHIDEATTNAIELWGT